MELADQHLENAVELAVANENAATRDEYLELARQQKPLVIYEPGGAWMWLRNQNLFRGLYRKTGRIEAADTQPIRGFHRSNGQAPHGAVRTRHAHRQHG